MDIRYIVSSLALAMTTGASAQNATTSADVPGRLRPAANASVALIARARGVQIYECRAAANQARAYEWTLVAPEAELFDSYGKRIGSHYAGPRWESTDGSTIAGTVEERVDAPQAGAIPWLLLATQSVGPNGSFSGITSVQRVNTVGGVAPQAPCSQSSAGSVARVPYTADYRFLAETADTGSRVKAAATPPPTTNYY